MKTTLLFLLSWVSLSIAAQQTTHSWTHNGITREYIQYIPASYDGNTAVPVVFCLHGLGDDMNNFYGIGMNYIADTANFIVITPQAIVDPLVNASAWNSGASYMSYTLNSNVDDVGFISAIIDTLVANYNVNQRRVYSCGFSMGGFMTNRLGCELNSRIAAIASVAGTIGSAVNCNPGRAVPACHFHGTADGTVAYSGNPYGNDAEDLALFWAGNNNCSTTPVVTTLPDIAADNFIITHKLFPSCTDGAEVELFRVDSADHIWLTPANDIFYTAEIWKFFSKHVHSNNVGVDEVSNVELNVFPNPSNDQIFVELEQLSSEKNMSTLHLINVMGAIVQSIPVLNSRTKFDLAELPAGTYFIELNVDGKRVATKKILVQ